MGGWVDGWVSDYNATGCLNWSAEADLMISWVGQLKPGGSKIRQFVTTCDPEYAEAGKTYSHFELKADLSLILNWPFRKIWELGIGKN